MLARMTLWSHIAGAPFFGYFWLKLYQYSLLCRMRHSSAGRTACMMVLVWVCSFLIFNSMGSVFEGQKLLIDFETTFPCPQVTAKTESFELQLFFYSRKQLTFSHDQVISKLLY